MTLLFQLTKLIFPALLVSLVFARRIHAAKGPVQVFILSGQSNMVGMAQVKHLSELINDTNSSSSCCPDEFKAFWDPSLDTFKTRDDVFYKYEENYGNLTIGAFRDRFGPEVGFGWALGDATMDDDKPILLIKAAHGGKDLAVDFRPPSSGMGTYPNIKPISYGYEYRDMVYNVLGSLQMIDKIVPGYNETLGYELVGFVWFQGWNDMLDWRKVNEYEQNLVNLFHDVKLDLDVPDMKFIVGEMGAGGLHPHGPGRERTLALRQAQRNATLHPAFHDCSLYVPTARYLVPNATGKWGPGYHYDGRADTMIHIGKAFGRGMLGLLGLGGQGMKHSLAARR